MLGGGARDRKANLKMDLKQIQDLFRATDKGDSQRLCKYIHPEVVLTMVGVEGVDAPFDRPGYFRFLEESIRYREGRNERTEHVPAHVKIEGSTIVVRGFLKIEKNESAEEADEYHPYTDVLKIRDGQIVEYDILYDI